MPNSLDQAQCEQLERQIRILLTEEDNLLREYDEVTPPFFEAVAALTAAKAAYALLASDLALWRERLQVAREQWTRCRARRGSDCRDEALSVREAREQVNDLRQRANDAAAEVESIQRVVDQLAVPAREVQIAISKNRAAVRDRKKRSTSGHCGRFAGP